MLLVLTSAQGCSRRRANRRIHIKVRQLNSLFRYAIDVRRLDQGIPKAARIRITHVIDEKDDNIWLLSERGNYKEDERKCKGK